jgi:hypothetical protein
MHGYALFADRHADKEDVPLTNQNSHLFDECIYVPAFSSESKEENANSAGVSVRMYIECWCVCV